MVRYVAFEPIGRFHSIDYESGYWTTNANDNSGHWITENGTDYGTWLYESGSETIGTWVNDNETLSGPWVATEDDPMTRYAAMNEIGTWYTVDNETTGFWTTFTNGTEGGYWISSEGLDNGTWVYDNENTTNGTWVNYNYTSRGIMYPLTNEDGEVDDENLLVRIVEIIPDCEDTANGLLDSRNYNCSRYDQYPEECGIADTSEGFIASYVCCSCGGGTSTEITDEELGDLVVEVIAEEYEENFDLDYFSDFPAEIEFDCDDDSTTEVWSSTDDLYLKFFIDNSECTESRGCFIGYKKKTSGTDNVLAMTFDCDDSVFEEYEDDVTFYVNEFPDDDITTSSDGRTRSVTSDAVFECSEVLAMPITVSIYYDEDMEGTSVELETQINLRKSTERTAEEIEDQLNAYNLIIDDDPEEEEETETSEETSEDEETTEEEDSTTTDDETAVEDESATTEDEATEDESAED